MADMVAFKNVDFSIGSFSMHDINFTIEKGEYFVILGPSGNGKTQLLKLLAGLNKVKGGEIWVDGERKDHLPPEDRGIGFVFQDHVLFPHMSVYDNIAFSLNLKKMDRTEIKTKVESMAETLGISFLLDRSPVNLSGGEKQRTALARAMVMGPKVLIMDEPYAALDRNLAERLTLEARELHDKLQQTTVHVTHNQEEAITLADRLCVLEAGKIKMIGTPDEVFRRPTSCFVAYFVCTENIYEKAVVENDDGAVLTLNYAGERVFCNYKQTLSKISLHESDEAGFFHISRVFSGITGEISFCVRPECTLLHTTRPEEIKKNAFEGEVVSIYDRGLMYQSNVRINEHFTIINLTMRKRFMDMNVDKGSKVYVSFDERNVHIIDESIKSLVTDLSKVKDII